MAHQNYEFCYTFTEETNISKKSVGQRILNISPSSKVPYKICNMLAALAGKLCSFVFH
jgi:hypothetical protein